MLQQLNIKLIGGFGSHNQREENMNIVTCKNYRAGDNVVLQLTGLDMEYYGRVKEVDKTQMKVEIPFYNSSVTYTLADGQQVTTLHKD